MDCTTVNNNLVTLSSAVKAAIIDKYEDMGKTEQRFSHWACREIKMLYNQILPKVTGKELLTVNQNTFTATLPHGFLQETFVGGINDKWHKVPFKINNRLVDSKNITDVPCADKCPKCQQDTGICNDLVITEETEIVVINDVPYNKTIVKKLYPNGDYYLETSTPVLNIDTDTVDTPYPVKKEFIVNFDLKPCGCLDTTPANIITLQTYCPEIWCNYYAPCEPCLPQNYGYKIFPESGLIQFDIDFPYEKIYLEYNSFLKKIKGQYFFPEVAFECVVEGIKKRAIKDKPNIPRWQILDQKQDYKEAKGNLSKILGRISLSRIIQSLNSLPKFDIDFGYDYYGCFATQSTVTVPATTSNVAACATTAVGSCSTVNNNYITINNRLSYTLAVKIDDTISGLTYYQNNLLVGATNIEYLILNNQILSLNKDEFTFDASSGTITFTSMTLFTDDSLIINYNKAA